jgi:hypothetical protein
MWRVRLPDGESPPRGAVLSNPIGERFF